MVSTQLEHNSVLRPLYHLSHRGIIDYDLVPFDGQGFIDPEDVARAIRPNTRLVIVCHASNVLGTVQPADEIGRICAEHDVFLLIDAAQSAGVIPIQMSEWNIAAVAFTGHKSLFGPTGIGGLVIHPGRTFKLCVLGGTGIDSKSLMHTQTFPHRLEAGTINLIGIIGLSAGLEFLISEGLSSIYRREMELLMRLREGLSGLNRVKLHDMDKLSTQ